MTFCGHKRLTSQSASHLHLYFDVRYAPLTLHRSANIADTLQADVWTRPSQIWKCPRRSSWFRNLPLFVMENWQTHNQRLAKGSLLWWKSSRGAPQSSCWHFKEVRVRQLKPSTPREQFTFFSFKLLEIVDGRWTATIKQQIRKTTGSVSRTTVIYFSPHLQLHRDCVLCTNLRPLMENTGQKKTQMHTSQRHAVHFNHIHCRW